jgi:penicillin-binding protein 1C
MRRCGKAIAVAGVAAITLALGWLALAPKAPPSFAEVKSQWRPSDVELIDRNGDPLYQRRIDLHGRRLAWTPLDEISPALESAVIASEDRRFYEHGGVDLRAVAGSMMRGAIGGHSRGASTITMQVAAMIDPTLGRGGHRRSLAQKIRQMRAAVAVERRWSKREIFEVYLNLVTWRGELQGVAAATRVMFGKAPQGVTAGEAAVMAALVRAPNARREMVARRALALGVAMGLEGPARDDVEAAVTDAFGHHSSALARENLAPHLAGRILTQAHGTARCTLDRDLQRVAVESLAAHVAEVRERGVNDGAVLVVENATGEVWAYVGGAGESSGAPWVDAIHAPRQPGSALKPFLYALAVERHLLTAASLVEDTPLELPEERGLYRPLDYDRQFRGLVSMRTALASSLNVPAVRTAELVGVEAFAAHLRELGLSSVIEDGDFYGAAIALGSADVTLWDLVGAYHALANNGVWSPLRISRASARDLASRQIYSAGTAFIVSDVLADRASRSETFGLENSLATRFWSAVKTGTSKDMRDNWCVGYTDRFTVGVWVGNVTGAPMRDVTGITGAAPVWLDVMNYLRTRYGSGTPRAPVGVLTRRVSFPDSVEAARDEWFAQGTEPAQVLAELDKNDARIESPAEGSIIAIDPDIPTDLQRVNFEAGRGASGARWILDGRERCAVSSSCLWQPVPGMHRLALVGAENRVIDQVAFQVRGVNQADQAEH